MCGVKIGSGPQVSRSTTWTRSRVLLEGKPCFALPAILFSDDSLLRITLVTLAFSFYSFGGAGTKEGTSARYLMVTIILKVKSLLVPQDMRVRCQDRVWVFKFQDRRCD